MRASSGSTWPDFPAELTPVRKLGQGGMGEVWHVRDGGLDRALKFATLGADPEVLERTAREAEALARLGGHPGILTVHRFIPGPPSALLLELVDGTDLELVLKSRRLPLKEALELAGKVAEALAFLHKNGIVHRDLKPANVLMARRGPVLSDFGLARLADLVTLTKTGAMVGTPHAMAPEQVEGRRVDARSDVWAFGVLLYELVTGVRPFRSSNSFALLTAILKASPRSPRELTPDLPERVEALILACLEKDPARRPADGAAVLSWLDPMREAPATRRRLPLGRVALVTAVVLLTLGLGSAFMKKREAWAKTARRVRLEVYRTKVQRELTVLERALPKTLPAALFDPLADPRSVSPRETIEERVLRRIQGRPDWGALVELDPELATRVDRALALLELARVPDGFKGPADSSKSSGSPTSGATATAKLQRELLALIRDEPIAGEPGEETPVPLDPLLSLARDRHRIEVGSYRAAPGAPGNETYAGLRRRQEAAHNLIEDLCAGGREVGARLADTVACRDPSKRASKRTSKRDSPSELLDRALAIALPRMTPTAIATLLRWLDKAARDPDTSVPRSTPEEWLGVLSVEARRSVIAALIETGLKRSRISLDDLGLVSLAAVSLPPEDRLDLLDPIPSSALTVIGGMATSRDSRRARIIGLDLVHAGRLPPIEATGWTSSQYEEMKFPGDSSRSRRRRSIQSLIRATRTALVSGASTDLELATLIRLAKVWQDREWPLTARCFAATRTLDLICKVEGSERVARFQSVKAALGPLDALARDLARSRLDDSAGPIRQLANLVVKERIQGANAGSIVDELERHFRDWPIEREDPPRPWLSLQSPRTRISRLADVSLLRARLAAQRDAPRELRAAVRRVYELPVIGRERLEALEITAGRLPQAERRALASEAFEREVKARPENLVLRLSELLRYCHSTSIGYPREVWLDQLCSLTARDHVEQFARLRALADTKSDRWSEVLPRGPRDAATPAGINSLLNYLRTKGERSLAIKVIDHVLAESPFNDADRSRLLQRRSRLQSGRD